LLHIAAIGVGAAGLGFGLYVHQVPFRGLQGELKRRAMELKTLRNEAERAKLEIERLRGDVRDANRARQAKPTHDRRPEVVALRLLLEERLKGVEVTVVGDRGRVRVRFPENDLFDARGPVITREGQERLRELGRLVAGHALLVRISAPLGNAAVARWTKAQFRNPTDFSVARVRNALRALERSGLPDDVLVGVIAATSPEGQAAATLDVEIEPKA
jgi:flagellar motor protein MotB